MDDVTVAVLVIVAAVAFGNTSTTKVNTALVDARLAVEQSTVPLAPTAGVVQDQPAGGVSDANAVFAGIAVLSDTFAALLGPALATVTV